MLAGAMLILSSKIPFLGKLPGDILLKKKNFTVYFPVATSIALSVVLSMLLILFGNLFRK